MSDYLTDGNALIAPMAASEFSAIGAAIWGPEWRPHAHRLLGKHIRTIRRWEAGDQAVPPGAALQMRVALAGNAVARSLPIVIEAIDREAAAGRVAEIRLAAGNEAQDLRNEMMVAVVYRAGRVANFKRVEASAEAPADRALEAALGRPGSRS